MESATTPISGEKSRRAPASAVLGAALVVVTFLAYSNTWHVPFLLDDNASIIENASIRDLSRLDAVFWPPSNSGTGGRPFANFTFALNYAWGDLRVGGYHAVNLLIHLTAALVLFRLIRRTLELPRFRDRFPPANARAIAFGAALLWAAHPLHTESVTYIAQRTESLMALLYLATLYSYVRGVFGSRGWYIAAIVSCILGMATKEVMVTAPVIVLLYDRVFIAGSFREVWQLRRGRLLGLAATWIPLIFFLAEVHERGVGHGSVTWWQYALTECRAILIYLRLSLWPAPLVFDYGTAVATSIAQVWPYVLGLFALVLATLVAWFRLPALGFLLGWVFILLAPASSVVPVAGQTMAEHRMYLPLVGIVVLATLALQRGTGRYFTLVVCGLGLLLATATFVRNRTYATTLSLWTDTAQKAPTNARAFAALGAAQLEKGDLATAIVSLERALKLDPRFAEAHNNLATALVDVNRLNDAVGHFTIALKLRPGTASTHYNFGNTLLALGRPARGDFTAGTGLNPATEVCRSLLCPGQRTLRRRTLRTRHQTLSRSPVASARSCPRALRTRERARTDRTRCAISRTLRGDFARSAKLGRGPLQLRQRVV